MASKNPVVYAETQLGVHEIYDKALKQLADLDDLSGELDKAQDEKRDLTSKIEDRQMEILADQRGKHADMSAAAMDKHLKVKYYEDDVLQSLQSKLRDSQGTVSGLELDIDVMKYAVKVSVGRMEELGGYFNYLAAAKNASSK